MIEQRSPEWFKARAGKITASEIATIMVKGKGENGWGAGAISYMYKLIGDILSTELEQGATSFAMQRGTDLEPEAKEHYREQTGLYVVDVPFKLLDGNEDIGASADSLAYINPLDDKPVRGVEFKCQEMKNHIANFFEEPCKDYDWQVQANMMVWELDEWDFVSYHPNCHAKMHLRTIKADKSRHEEMIERCNLFMIDMRKKLEVVKAWKMEVSK